MKYFGFILAWIIIGLFHLQAQKLVKPTPTPSFKGFSADEGLSFYSKPKYKFSEKLFTQSNLQKLESPKSKGFIKRLPPDQMPNLQPIGIFPSRNLIPDNTRRYSLIITDPTKIKISKKLHEQLIK